MTGRAASIYFGMQLFGCCTCLRTFSVYLPHTTTTITSIVILLRMSPRFGASLAGASPAESNEKHTCELHDAHLFTATACLFLHAVAVISLSMRIRALAMQPLLEA